MHQMPKSNQNHKKLGKMTYEVGLEGFFVIGDYVEEQNGNVVYRGHSVFGWDDQQKSKGPIPANSAPHMRAEKATPRIGPDSFNPIGIHYRHSVALDRGRPERCTSSSENGST